MIIYPFVYLTFNKSPPRIKTALSSERLQIPQLKDSEIEFKCCFGILFASGVR